jgi:hypothetical protein
MLMVDRDFKAAAAILLEGVRILSLSTFFSLSFFLCCLFLLTLFCLDIYIYLGCDIYLY